MLPGSVRRHGVEVRSVVLTECHLLVAPVLPHQGKDLLKLGAGAHEIGDARTIERGSRMRPPVDACPHVVEKGFASDALDDVPSVNLECGPGRTGRSIHTDELPDFRRLSEEAPNISPTQVVACRPKRVQRVCHRGLFSRIRR